MRIVGLTGGSGCGKTTVADRWRSHGGGGGGGGLRVIDADALARAAAEPGAWGYRRLRAAVDAAFFDPTTGRLDRRALGAAAWRDPSIRRAVNRATHLPIMLALARSLITAWLACTLVVVLDVPLLFETGLWRICRPRVLVDAPVERQVARIVARDGLSAADAAARVAAQAPASTKKARCAVVIDNDRSLDDLNAAADAAAAAVLRGATWHWLLTPPALVAAVAAVAAVAVWGVK